jgi:trk system potassium uptake protein
MRHAAYLRQRYKVILGYSGFIWLITGLLIALPVLALPFFWDEWQVAWGFALPGALLALAGYGLWRRCAPTSSANLTLQEGAIIVVIVWLTAIATGALPFMLVEGMGLTPAIFESTSGWSTTGLSVVDVTAVSPITLLYRSIIQFAGGAGFAIIMLSVLSGPAGIGFTGAEGRNEQLAPHVKRSARLVVRLYLAYAVLGVIALSLAGMSVFDALNHAFAALSTGGFSTRVESIGYWDSALVEWVVIFLMILGTTNFLTVYALLQGNFRSVRRTAELHLMLALLLTAVPALLFGVTLHLYPTQAQAMRVALFEAVSAISTTGFSTVGYGGWPPFGWIVMIILMVIGGGGGSTAGGLKQYRVYIVLKGIFWEFRRSFHSHLMQNAPEFWNGGRPQTLRDENLRQVALYAALHLLSLVFLAMVMTAYGYSLPESLFEAASTVSTVGLSVGITAVDAPAGLLWAQIVGMFLGRLEYIAVVVGLVRLLDDTPALLSTFRRR